MCVRHTRQYGWWEYCKGVRTAGGTKRHLKRHLKRQGPTSARRQGTANVTAKQESEVIKRHECSGMCQGGAKHGLKYLIVCG